MADSVHTTGMPKIDRCDVMRMAWETYRKQIGDNEFPFSRKLFSAHLASAWSVCRVVAHQVRAQAEEAAQRASTNPAVRRTAELRAELRGLETSDFIDWSRHRDLSAELFRLGA